MVEIEKPREETRRKQRSQEVKHMLGSKVTFRKETM